MDRRDFLTALALAALPGTGVAASGDAADRLYQLPASDGAATLLHLTDCHAQLLPVHFREPDTNISTGSGTEKLAHLTGQALLKHYGFRRESREAYAYSHLDFPELARQYGRMGGFAHLATLVRRIKSQRPGAVLVDGGDTWQGSATALWTRGGDMVEASRLLGIEVMTGHWEFTLGAERVNELAEQMRDSIEFVAQNIFARDFGDRIFPSHVVREINGLEVAIIGQAYPYTPIANPQHLIPDWTFGIHEQPLQQIVNEVRRKGAAAVVLLSHNGVDVDLKLAGRVHGIDAILGGHTHDPLPRAISVANQGGRTLVTNAGSNGKFLGVLDIRSRNAHIECDYRLLPVFSNLLEPDADMSALIRRVRKPFQPRLEETIATTDALLYRRGNFNGSFDEVVLQSLMRSQDAPIALSPGFRWGTSLLPGETVTVEAVMAQTAITYPWVNVRELRGAEIKDALEDIADNLFNPDPYYRQGGDMVRTGGLTYRCKPAAPVGHRILDLRLNGAALQAERRYRVAGWASVQDAQPGRAPIWEVVIDHLRRSGRIGPQRTNTPALV
ncbi:MAG TPA: thiosulfohydrolase SoxB [Burkholderiales bacterium]